MFRALGTSQDQTSTYNKHTHEGASHKNNKNDNFLSHRKFELASATCQNAGNQDLPFRSWSTSSPRGNSEAPAMSPGDAPELNLPDVEFPRDRLQVSKKWLLRTRSKHFGPLTWVFLKARDAWNLSSTPWWASRHCLVFLTPEQPRDPSCCLG